jgi:hypothetical protein
MKKILLVAASLAALGSAGQSIAEGHNYVGMGLGWTMAKAKTTSDDINFNLHGNNSIRTRKTATDDGAASGKISVGHHFGGDLGWLVEAGFGMDSTKTQTKYLLKGDAGAVPGSQDLLTISLRRKYTLSLGTGFSKAIGGSFNAHAKVSLLASKFQVTGSGTGDSLALAGAYPGSSTKTKTKLGGGVTIGGSKNITQDLSLGLDYTFEMYQKIKTTSPEKNVGGDFITGFNRTMKPCYHTVMLTLARKF